MRGVICLHRFSSFLQQCREAYERMRILLKNNFNMANGRASNQPSTATPLTSVTSVNGLGRTSTLQVLPELTL